MVVKFLVGWLIVFCKLCLSLSLSSCITRMEECFVTKVLRKLFSLNSVCWRSVISNAGLIWLV